MQANQTTTATRGRLTLLALAVATLLAGAASAGDRPAERGRDDRGNTVPSFLSEPQFTRRFGDWHAVGTVTHSARGELIVGDYIGYDSADIDGDLNPVMIWQTGSTSAGIGGDVDLIISRRAHRAGVVLSFNGCIPNTTQSYHFVGLLQTNPAFTGAPASASTEPMLKGFGISFSTRWEQSDMLFVTRTFNGIPDAWNPVPDAVRPRLGADGFCARYRIERKSAMVRVFVNDRLVYEGAAPADVPLSAVVQTFDRPARFKSMDVWPDAEGHHGHSHHRPRQDDDDEGGAGLSPFGRR